MSYGQAPEAPCAGLAAFYFASARPCAGPAEVCFVAKLTGEGLADCHFVSDRLRAGLTEHVGRLSELPEGILLINTRLQNFPKTCYSWI